MKRILFILVVLLTSCTSKKKIFESIVETKRDSIVVRDSVIREVETIVRPLTTGSIRLTVECDSLGVKPVEANLDLGGAEVSVRAEGNKIDIDAVVDSLVSERVRSIEKSYELRGSEKDHVLKSEKVKYRLSRWCFLWAFLAIVFFMLWIREKNWIKWI